MKTFSILPIVTLSAALFATPVRADDPAAIKLAPEVQAMLKDLLKDVDADPKPDAKEAKPATAPATPAATTAPATPATAPKAVPSPTPAALRAVTLQTGSLQTGSLGTGSLGTSAPLGGHGKTGGTPRPSPTDWRLLFPLKDQK